ncbi:MAG TPA: adenylyl-sulfate kinase [Bacteroidia bacterium]|jgi:adenylylsulfate kinase|nr:adenylyl-sulfate kinase [Bacteroidia bacterium]
MPQSIFPTDKILSREAKEKILGQQGKAIWMTGLSGSGKTTLAVALEKELYARGRLTQVLDGDNIRSGLNSNLGFSEADRMENIRRIAEVTRLFVQCGLITVCCFVSPTEVIRRKARAVIGENDFMEVYVNSPLAVCEERDVKGLYAKARKGELPDFTGIHAPFEAPQGAAIELDTATMSVNDCVSKIMKALGYA